MASYPAATRSYSITGLTVVIGVHLVVAVLLLQLEPVRSAVIAAAPITVRLLTPSKPQAEILPQPLPVTPRVQKVRPVETRRITTVVTEAPTPFVTLAPLAEPPRVAPSEPVVAGTRVPDVPPAPPPASVTPPSFNAGYLNNPPPAYPALSRRTGEEGKVVLRVFVDEQGLPAQVQMRTSSGHARLDDVAMTTVRQWRFVPARRGDTPVSAWVLVPISFTLRG